MKSLEDILFDKDINDLPDLWQWRSEDLIKFSNRKHLFEFQQKALENAIKTLWFYYAQDEEINGENLKHLYIENKLGKPFENFGVNRMGFWMATGSGKTLVIVKLIELISLLGERGNIPKLDIMFLVYRENLLEQFKIHVDEYNASNPKRRINLINLQDYEKTKNDNALAFADDINVYYYRADLFLDGKSTAKKISMNSCDNNGNWFVLLDEAHRGDSSDSKLQNIYSHFSRNGFMFNFSATFTDTIDLVTCACNFNLEKFIESGYGKKIYVSGDNIDGFREKDEFSDIEKQRVVLKALILQTYIKQNLNKIREKHAGMYHNPLLLTIVNSVNSSGKVDTKDKPDLQLFFSEIEKIASGKIETGLFNKAKKELREELKTSSYVFGGEEIVINEKSLSDIKYKNLLESVFNTPQKGAIEAIYHPNNKQEIVFQMKKSGIPFALIKIGDTSKWVKDILVNNEPQERYLDESFFSKLNEESSNINILMGSRTFYEGWDSNRPNIVLFVNIGMGKDAKKFVLQSIGRGVRVEPIQGERKRVQHLINSSKIDIKSFNNINEDTSSLETLHIFGTNPDNLRQIIRSLKGDKGDIQEFDLFGEFIVNEAVNEKLLLIPKYKDSSKLLADRDDKYPISEEDLSSTQKFFDNLDDKILLVKYGRGPAAIKNTKEKVKKMIAHEEDIPIHKTSFIAGRLIDYCNLHSKELSEFNKLDDDDIIHFKKVKLIGTEDDYQAMKMKLAFMREYPSEEKKIDEARKEGSLQDFEEMYKLFKSHGKFEMLGDKPNTNIKYLANHYYHPLLVTEKDKLTYLTHIISVPSEASFIKVLEGQIDALDKEFDWWMFSKLDETLDKVSIPYFNKNKNEYSLFNPDFIFWFEKGNEYSILFIDPKGMAHTEYLHKVDGHVNLFGKVKSEKSFSAHGKKIKVYLRLFNKDAGKAPEILKDYWIDDTTSIANIIR